MAHDRFPDADVPAGYDRPGPGVDNHSSTTVGHDSDIANRGELRREAVVGVSRVEADRTRVVDRSRAFSRRRVNRRGDAHRGPDVGVPEVQHVARLEVGRLDSLLQQATVGQGRGRFHRITVPVGALGHEQRSLGRGNRSGARARLKRRDPEHATASPTLATWTSKQPPGRRYGDASAVTSTAATFRVRSMFSGTSTLKRRSRFATERTVWPAEKPPMTRSPVPSSPITSPYPTKRIGMSPWLTVRSRMRVSWPSASEANAQARSTPSKIPARRHPSRRGAKLAHNAADTS